MSALTRRRFLGVTTAAGAAVVLAGTGGSSTQAADATPSPAGSGAWSFTDDRGSTVSLEARPTRIVAYDVAASALINFGVKVIGIFASFPPDKNPHLVGLDLSGVTILSEAYGAMSLEALAATRPDLIVTVYEPRQTGPLLGFPDQAYQDRVQQIAPIVAFDAYKDYTGIIDRFEELGVSLGVDPDAPAVTGAHQRFQAASARLQAATAAKPEITAVALSAGSSWGINFVRPDSDPALRFYQQLGLQLVRPTSPPGDPKKDYVSYRFENASFEQVDKYPADLILYAKLPVTLDLQALGEIPTWQRLPAVQAGQLVPWTVDHPLSYKVFGANIDELAAAVEAAKDVTGAA